MRELNKDMALLVANAANARFSYLARYDQEFQEARRSRRVAIAEFVINYAYNFVTVGEDKSLPIDFLLEVTRLLIDSKREIAEYLVLQEQTDKDEE